MKREEQLTLTLTEWYDGETVYKSTKDIPLTPTKYTDDLIFEIARLTPSHLSLLVSIKTIKEWIEGNRDAEHYINDSILIADTNTLDVQQINEHLNTLGGFSGTQYDLWHEVSVEGEEND